MSKYLFNVLIFCLPVLLHGQQPAGEPIVNRVFRNVPLSKALKTIQADYDVKIAYDPSLVQNMVVDMELRGITVTESMQRLLHGTGLTFHRVAENIVIVPAPRVSNAGIVEKPDVKISGKVLDADTDETLPNAVVRVLEKDLVATTNDDGYFTILHIPSDTLSVVISYMGYITQTVRIRDISDPRQFNVRMKSDTKVLNEVVVLDEYNQATQVQELPGAFAFNPKSLSSLPSLGEQDILRTMQLMPGVTATDESSSGMVIRGMQPGYNLVTLDGMTIYQQDHFFGAFSIINSDVVKDVRVHKGMFDAKYGGRVSGIIDITTKNGSVVKPVFNARINSVNGKGTAEIPIGKKWSVFIGGRRSFTDVVQSTLFNDLFDIAGKSDDQIQLFPPPFLLFDIGTPGKPRYHFYDANAKVSYRPSNRDILSLSLYTSTDKMKISDAVSVSADNEVFVMKDSEFTQWGNHGLSLRWARQWNDRYYSNIRISDSKFYRRYEFDQQVMVNPISSHYFMEFDNSISDVSFAIENEWLFHDRLSFEFGASGVHQGTDFNAQDKYMLWGGIPDDEIPDDINAAEEAESWLSSIYGSAIASVTSKFTMTLGARLSHYYSDESQLYFEPRLTARYNISGALHLKGAYGHSNQFINQMIDYTPNGSQSGISQNVWLLSHRNGDYPVISTDHYSAGATLKSKHLVYDAEVYYKQSKGVIIDEDLNSGNTTSYGLDAVVQKISGIHKGWIAYSLARGLQSHPYILNGQSVPSLQDQRHEFKVFNMLTLGHWNVSSTFIYGSGKPYPKFNVRYHRNNEGRIDNKDLLLDYSNEARLPPYYRIDLGISYRAHIKSQIFFDVGLSIHNISNHKNIKTRRVDENGLDEAIHTNTEIQPTYRDIVLLGFTPSLFINITF